MKKVIKTFLIIYLFFAAIGYVHAETYALNEEEAQSEEKVIPDNALVIGTHLITDPSKASTQLIMNATQTIIGDDAVIFQKLASKSEMDDEENYPEGWWIDAIGGDDKVPANVKGLICITHVNGTQVEDPDCDATRFSVKFSGITDETGEKTVYIKNGEKITAADIPTPKTKKGYEFVCWVTKDTRNEDHDSCYDFSKTISANVELNPYYDLIQYKIHFDLNGLDSSSPAIGDQTCTIDELANIEESNCKLPSLNETRKGYKFDGWSTVKDETGEKGTHFEANDSMADMLGDEYDITLYAVWTPVLYDITYNLNGGTYQNQTVVKSSYSVLTRENIELFTPSRTGYTFNGWDVTDPSSGGTVQGPGDADGGKYKLTVEEGKLQNITLTAKWKEKEYTITYDLNLEPAKVNANASNKVYATLLADKDLQAPNNTECKFESGCVLATAPERDDYIFAGWADENGYLYAEKKDYKGVDFPKDTVALKAQWNAKNEPLYKITYKLDGGSFIGEAVEQYGRKTVDVALPTPKKVGYTFESWCSDEEKTSGCKSTNATIKDFLEGDGETLKDITLYAKWKANSYTVKFYEPNVATILQFSTMAAGVPGAGSVEIAESSKTCEYDKECPLTDHSSYFENKKEILRGWSLSYGEKSNNNSVYLSDNITVKNLTSEEDGVVNLYAVAESIEYNITYYLDGGKFPEDQEPTKVPNSAVKDEEVTIPNPTKDGYKFDKWVDKDGNDINEISKQDVQDSVKVTVKNDLFLVAVWTQKDPEMKSTNDKIENAKINDWIPVTLKISPNNHNGIKAKIVVTITKDSDSPVSKDQVEARLNEVDPSLPFVSTETAKTDENGKLTLPTSSGFRLKAGSACELATIDGACAEKDSDGQVTKKYDFKFNEAGTYKVKFQVFDYNYPEDGALSTTEMTITVGGQS